jgi:hypothetical protein
MDAQSPRSPTRDSFETPPWESQEKVPFGCSLGKELQRILYGGRWWLPPSPGRGESSESKCPWLVPTSKGVPKCELTLLWLVLDAGTCKKIIVPLPSLIPGLLARPSHPLSFNFSQFNILKPSSESNKELRNASKNQMKKNSNHLNYLITKFLLKLPLELFWEWCRDNHTTGIFLQKNPYKLVLMSLELCHNKKQKKFNTSISFPVFPKTI